MFPPDTRILVVDDTKSLRDLLAAYLRRLGYTRIDSAEDGLVGLRCLESAHSKGEPYGLVISDWNMPIMSGLEFLREVRAMPYWKNLPFMLLTTESEKDKVVEAVHAQVSNYLVKPVDQATLQEKMEKVWEKHQAP